LLIDYVRETLLQVLQEIDEDGDNRVSRKEFRTLMAHCDARVALVDLDVDADAFAIVSDYLFDPDPSDPDGPEQELSFKDFLNRVLKMRSCNQATVMDIMELTKFVQREDVGVKYHNNKVSESVRDDLACAFAKVQPADKQSLQTVEGRMADGVDQQFSRLLGRLDQTQQKLTSS
jgi:hypothetical protein